MVAGGFIHNCIITVGQTKATILKFQDIEN